MKYLKVALAGAFIVTLGYPWMFSDADAATRRSTARPSTPVFYGPERSLAGITIGRPASQFLNRYGNPTRIQVGTGAGEATATVGAQPINTSDPNASLPSPAGFNLPSLPGLPQGQALGSIFASTMMPGMTGPSQAMPGIAAPGAPAASPRTVTKYYYDYASGPTLVFTVGWKGMVEQIDAFAPWPWSPARTARGIGIGATYRAVVARYGFPDDQKQNADGTFLMDYSKKARCAFTLLSGKVVGISVALVE